MSSVPEESKPFSEKQAGEQHEVDSQKLLQGQREVIIRHGTEAYRLSVTRSGKLILRK